MRRNPLLFLFLFAFIPGAWGQYYLTKVDETGRTYKSSSPASKIRKHFTLDYYGYSKAKYGYANKVVSTLFITFNPNASRVLADRFTVSFFSRDLYAKEIKLWIQDPKTGKRYYPVHVLPGGEELAELSDWSCIGMVTPFFYLYNRGGSVPFSVDFQPLPQTVEVFDVYYDGYILFEGVKARGKKNYLGGKEEVPQDFYSFPSVSLVSCELGRNVILKEAGRMGPIVGPSMPAEAEESCRRASGSITIAFPKNYSNATLEIEAYKSLEDQFKTLILRPSILAPPCINISN